MIRANQGHSMEGITPDLEPLNLKEIPLAVHGTYSEAWEMIKEKGISKMQRNHIHLAKDLPGSSGVISGMRAKCQVLIWVDLVKADSDGIRFFQSENGVILRLRLFYAQPFASAECNIQLNTHAQCVL